MRPTLNERTLSRTLFLLGVLLALASPRPFPAHAASPAPSVLMRLDDRLLQTSRVRITTPSGWLVAEGARVSVEGLAYHNILATAGGGARPIPGCIPWEETVRVDRPSNHALGAVLVSGLVMGIFAGLATRSEMEQGNDFAGLMPLLVAVPVVGLATGVGALTPAWHPIYRKPHAPARGR